MRFNAIKLVLVFNSSAFRVVIMTLFALTILFSNNTEARKRAYPVNYNGSFRSTVMQYYAESNGTKNEFIGFEEDVRMSLNSFIYNRYFMKYTLDFGASWRRNNGGTSTDIDATSIDQDSFEHYYGLTLNIMEQSFFPTSVWARRSVNEVDQDHIGTSRTITDTLGGAFSIVYGNIPKNNAGFNYVSSKYESPLRGELETEQYSGNASINKSTELSRTHIRVSQDDFRDLTNERESITQRAFLGETIYPTERLTIYLYSNFSKSRNEDKITNITNELDTSNMDSKIIFRASDRVTVDGNYSFSNSTRDDIVTISHHASSNAYFKYTERYSFYGGVSGSYSETMDAGDIFDTYSQEGAHIGGDFVQPIDGYTYSYGYRGSVSATQKHGPVEDEEGIIYVNALNFGLLMPPMLYFRHALELDASYTTDTADDGTDREFYSANLTSNAVGIPQYMIYNRILFTRNTEHFENFKRTRNQLSDDLNVRIKKWEKVTLSGYFKYNWLFGDIDTTQYYQVGATSLVKLMRQLEWRTQADYTVTRTEHSSGDKDTINADSDLTYRYGRTSFSLIYKGEYITNSSDSQEHLGMFRVRRDFRGTRWF